MKEFSALAARGSHPEPLQAYICIYIYIYTYIATARESKGLFQTQVEMWGPIDISASPKEIGAYQVQLQYVSPAVGVGIYTELIS